MRIMHFSLLLIAGLFLVSITSMGMTFMLDMSNFKDATERERIDQAASSLLATNDDLPALETLLAFFGDRRLYPTYGGSLIYSNADATMSKAHQAVYFNHSTNLLAAALNRGSESAAYWALYYLDHSPIQVQVTRPPAALPDAIFAAETNLSSKLRDLALDTICEQGLIDDIPTLLKSRLQNRDEPVVVVAIKRLATINNRHLASHVPDVQTDQVIWQKLAETKNDELVVACLKYIWLANEPEINPAVTEKQATLLDRISQSTNSAVRAATASAISERATPGNPAMIALLLHLADDKDEQVAGTALVGLRNANTPEINRVLRQYFNSKGSSLVRSDALGTLGCFGSKNPDVFLAAAKDADPNIRGDAALYLRSTGGTNAIAALESLTNDPESNVRRQAATQLEWALKEAKTRASR
jgi:HEAT repeat protein